ncbi:MAG: PIG-L family deacetylase [Pirellulaceae bacterium]
MTRAIAITAHHDDAVLWCGGTILRTNQLGWKWTVVALCVPDRQKQRYFDEYCNAAKVEGRRFGFKDYQVGPTFSQNSKQSMKDEIQQIMNVSPFDFVFTHSRDVGGEYGGHANHDEARDATFEILSPDKVICFSYNPEFGYNGRATTARRDADYHVQLKYEELIHKATWCQLAPDAESSLQAIGFPCPNPEGFRTAKHLSAPFIPR